MRKQARDQVRREKTVRTGKDSPGVDPGRDQHVISISALHAGRGSALNERPHSWTWHSDRSSMIGSRTLHFAVKS